MSSFASKGRVGYSTDFTGGVIPTEVTGLSENSGTAATVVGKVNGVVGLITGTSSGNRSQLVTGLNHKADDGTLIYVCTALNLTDVATRANFFGWTDTVSIENPIELSGVTITANATDAVGFVYDTAATTDVIYIQGVKAGAATALKAATNPVTGGTYTPVAGTYDEYRIEVNTDGDASFFINGEYVGTVEDAVTTSVLLTPTALVETRTTAASTVYVDWFEFESGRDRTP